MRFEPTTLRDLVRCSKLFKLSQRDKQKFLGLNDIYLNSVSLAFLKQHSRSFKNFSYKQLLEV